MKGAPTKGFGPSYDGKLLPPTVVAKLHGGGFGGLPGRAPAVRFSKGGFSRGGIQTLIVAIWLFLFTGPAICAQSWQASGFSNGSFPAKNAMAVDAAGNVHITGTTLNGTKYDLRTAKYDTNGVQQWATVYSAPAGSAFPVAVKMDALGNVFVTGYEVASGFSSGARRIVTLKYNNAGVQQWVAFYDPDAGSSGSTYPVDMAISATGNVYVTGKRTINNVNSLVTIMYDAQGTQQWSATHTGTGYTYLSDGPVALAVDGSGAVYVTGVEHNGTNTDAVTIKYDASGAQQWQTIFNGPANGNDYPRALTLDASGNVFVTGAAWSGNYSSDIFTVKYDSSGVQQWQAAYGPATFSASGDSASALAV